MISSKILALLILAGSAAASYAQASPKNVYPTINPVKSEKSVTPSHNIKWTGGRNYEICGASPATFSNCDAYLFPPLVGVVRDAISGIFVEKARASWIVRTEKNASVCAIPLGETHAVCRRIKEPYPVHVNISATATNGVGGLSFVPSDGDFSAGTAEMGAKVLRFNRSQEIARHQLAIDIENHTIQGFDDEGNPCDSDVITRTPCDEDDWGGDTPFLPDPGSGWGSPGFNLPPGVGPNDTPAQAQCTQEAYRGWLNMDDICRRYFGGDYRACNDANWREYTAYLARCRAMN